MVAKNDYEELKESILKDWESIKHKHIGETNEAEERKINLWMEHPEIAKILVSSEDVKKTIQLHPEAEIFLIKAPVEYFSRWFKAAKKKKKFQKEVTVENAILIYERLLQINCSTREAEFIRLSLIEDYKKCIIAFKGIRSEKNSLKLTAKPHATKYNSLNEIFLDEARYLQCMDALRDSKLPKPIISTDNKYLLGPRSKGAFAAWQEIISRRGKIKTVPNAILATLLNKEIEGLNLYSDGGTLGDRLTTSYKKYYTPLSQIIK